MTGSSSLPTYKETFSQYNDPILESENFIVIPSVGSLVEGWMLIIPKKFALNFTNVPSYHLNELSALISECANLLKSVYPESEIVLFEHGPIKPCTKIGCTVDYAHLHIVPLNFNLCEAVKKVDNHVVWKEINGVDSILGNKLVGANEYWYMSRLNGQAFIANNLPSVSQFFRRVIAKEIGLPEEFNWREHPNSEALNSGVEKLLSTKVCFA